MASAQIARGVTSPDHDRLPQKSTRTALASDRRPQARSR
jgi:hypothetical protein